MPRIARRPNAPAPGGPWFVYLVRCADCSLYSGIARDVARRCREHDAGTASNYSRSRRPVELVYYEAQPDRSSLKREAAIKALGRPGKLALVRWRANLASAGRPVARLEDVPNVGPAVAADPRRVGIGSPAIAPAAGPYPPRSLVPAFPPAAAAALVTVTVVEQAFVEWYVAVGRGIPAGRRAGVEGRPTVGEQGAAAAAGPGSDRAGRKGPELPGPAIPGRADRLDRGETNRPEHEGVAALRRPGAQPATPTPAGQPRLILPCPRVPVPRVP